MVIVPRKIVALAPASREPEPKTPPSAVADNFPPRMVRFCACMYLCVALCLMMLLPMGSSTYTSSAYSPVEQHQHQHQHQHQQRQRQRHDISQRTSDSAPPATLEHIALFVLATTRPFGGKSSFESRLVPLSHTWAAALSQAHVYFVMGANQFDYDFLKNGCRLIRMEGEGIEQDAEEIGAWESNVAAESATARTMRTRMTGNDSPSARLGRSGVAPNSGKAYNGRQGDDLKTRSSGSSVVNDRRRKLKPRYKQRVSENRRLLYDCDISRHASQFPPSPQHSLNVLFTANCTGEYFGHGPTCRCQESLRFFQYHRHIRSAAASTNSPSVGTHQSHSSSSRRRESHRLFAGVEWFVFMDDDLYVRPYSLQSLLNAIGLESARHGPHFREAHASPRPYTNIEGADPGAGITLDDVSPQRTQRSPNPIALIQSEFPRGFEFSSRWDRAKVNCKVSGIHDLYLAMPLVLNTAAVTLLQAGIDANGMTRMQELWGGTHDIIAPLMMWMHSIPLYSVGKSYFGGRFYVESAHTYSFDPDIHIIVHNVKNMQITTKGGGPSGNMNSSSSVISMFSHYDAAVAFQDCQASEAAVDVCAYYGYGDNATSSSGGKFGINARDPMHKPLPRYVDRDTMIRRQTRAGLAAYGRIVRIPMSHINATVFAEAAAKLNESFVYFQHKHCALLPEAQRKIVQVSARSWVYEGNIPNKVYLEAAGNRVGFLG